MAKKDIPMEENLTEQETTSVEDPMKALVEKMVEEALAKRTAELDAREAAIAAQEAKVTSQTGAVEADAPVEPVISKAWEEKREIFLPYATKGEEQFIFVAVNGRKYQVPRGRSVSLPLPLYERIKIMQEAESRTVEYRNSLPNEEYPGAAEAKRIG